MSNRDESPLFTTENGEPVVIDPRHHLGPRESLEFNQHQHQHSTSSIDGKSLTSVASSSLSTRRAKTPTTGSTSSFPRKSTPTATTAKRTITKVGEEHGQRSGTWAQPPSAATPIIREPQRREHVAAATYEATPRIVAAVTQATPTPIKKPIIVTNNNNNIKKRGGDEESPTLSKNASSSFRIPQQKKTSSKQNSPTRSASPTSAAVLPCVAHPTYTGHKDCGCLVGWSPSPSPFDAASPNGQRFNNQPAVVVHKQHIQPIGPLSAAPKLRLISPRENVSTDSAGVHFPTVLTCENGSDEIWERHVFSGETVSSKPLFCASSGSSANTDSLLETVKISISAFCAVDLTISSSSAIPNAKKSTVSSSNKTRGATKLQETPLKLLFVGCDKGSMRCQVQDLSSSLSGSVITKPIHTHHKSEITGLLPVPQTVLEEFDILESSADQIYPVAFSSSMDGQIRAWGLKRQVTSATPQASSFVADQSKTPKNNKSLSSSTTFPFSYQLYSYPIASSLPGFRCMTMMDLSPEIHISRNPIWLLAAGCNDGEIKCYDCSDLVQIALNIEKEATLHRSLSASTSRHPLLHSASLPAIINFEETAPAFVLKGHRGAVRNICPVRSDIYAPSSSHNNKQQNQQEGNVNMDRFAFVQQQQQIQNQDSISASATVIGVRRELWTAGDDKTIKVWTMPSDTNNMIASLRATISSSTSGHRSPVCSLTSIKNARMFATDEDGRVSIYRLDTAELVHADDNRKLNLAATSGSSSLTKDQVNLPSITAILPLAGHIVWLSSQDGSTNAIYVPGSLPKSNIHPSELIALQDGIDEANDRLEKQEELRRFELDENMNALRDQVEEKFEEMKAMLEETTSAKDGLIEGYGENLSKELNEEIIKLLQEAQIRIVQLQTRNTELETANKELNQKFDETDQEVSSTRTKSKELNAVFNETKKKLSLAEGRFIRTRDELATEKARADRLESERPRLAQTAEQAELKAAEQLKRAVTAEAKMRSLKEETTRAQQRATLLETQMQKLQTTIDELSTKLTEQTKRGTETDEKNRQLSRQQSETGQKLTSLTKQQQQTESQLSAAEAKNTELTASVQELKTKLKAVTAELESANEKQSKLDEERSKLRMELRNAKMDIEKEKSKQLTLEKKLRTEHQAELKKLKDDHAKELSEAKDTVEKEKSAMVDEHFSAQRQRELDLEDKRRQESEIETTKRKEETEKLEQTLNAERNRLQELAAAAEERASKQNLESEKRMEELRRSLESEKQEFRQKEERLVSEQKQLLEELEAKHQKEIQLLSEKHQEEFSELEKRLSEESERKIKALQSKIDGLESRENQSADEALQSTISKLSIVEKEKEPLEQQVQEAENKYRSQMQANQPLMDLASNSENEISNLRRQLDEADQQQQQRASVERERQAKQKELQDFVEPSAPSSPISPSRLEKEQTTDTKNNDSETQTESVKVVERSATPIKHLLIDQRETATSPVQQQEAIFTTTATTETNNNNNCFSPSFPLPGQVDELIAILNQEHQERFNLFQHFLTHKNAISFWSNSVNQQQNQNSATDEMEKRFTETVSKLESDIRQKESQIASLREKFQQEQESSIERERNQMENQHQEITKQAEEYQQQIQQLEDNLDFVKSQRNSILREQQAMKQEFEQMLDMMKTDLEHSKKQLELSGGEQLAALQKQMEEHKDGAAKRQKKLTKELEEMKENLDKTTKQLEREKNINRELAPKIQTAQLEAANSKIALATAKKEHDDYRAKTKERLDQTTTDLTAVRNELDALKTKLESTQAQSGQHETQLDVANKKVVALTAELEQVRSQLGEVHELQKQVARFRDAARLARLELDQSNADLEETRSRLDSFRTQMDSLHEDYDSATKELNDVKSSREDYHKAAELAKYESETAQRKMLEAVKDANEKSSQFSTLKHQREEILKEYQISESENETKKKELELVHSRVRELEQQLATSRKEAATSNDSLLNMTRELQTAKEALVKLESAHVKLKNEHAFLVEESSRNIDDVNNELRRQLEQQRVAAVSNKHRLDLTNKELDDTRAILERMQNDRDNAKSEISGLKMRLEILTAKHEGSVKQLDAAERNTEQVSAFNNNLQIQLSQRTKELEAARAALAHARGQLGSTSEEMARSQSEHFATSKLLEKRTALLEHLGKDFETLSANHKTLSKQHHEMKFEVERLSDIERLYNILTSKPPPELDETECQTDLTSKEVTVLEEEVHLRQHQVMTMQRQLKDLLDSCVGDDEIRAKIEQTFILDASLFPHNRTSCLYCNGGLCFRPTSVFKTPVRARRRNFPPDEDEELLDGDANEKKHHIQTAKMSRQALRGSSSPNAAAATGSPSSRRNHSHDSPRKNAKLIASLPPAEKISERDDLRMEIKARNRGTPLPSKDDRKKQKEIERREYESKRFMNDDDDFENDDDQHQQQHYFYSSPPSADRNKNRRTPLGQLGRWGGKQQSTSSSLPTTPKKSSKSTTPTNKTRNKSASPSSSAAAAAAGSPTNPVGEQNLKRRLAMLIRAFNNQRSQQTKFELTKEISRIRDKLAEISPEYANAELPVKNLTQ